MENNIQLTSKEWYNRECEERNVRIFRLEEKK